LFFFAIDLDSKAMTRTVMSNHDADYTFHFSSEAELLLAIVALVTILITVYVVATRRRRIELLSLGAVAYMAGIIGNSSGILLFGGNPDFIPLQIKIAGVMPYPWPSTSSTVTHLCNVADLLVATGSWLILFGALRGLWGYWQLRRAAVSETPPSVWTCA
jgi:lipoprotein signal peptidase